MKKFWEKARQLAHENWQKTKQFARENEDMVVIVGLSVAVVGAALLASLGCRQFNVQDEAAALARAAEHFKSSHGAVKGAGKLMKWDKDTFIYRTVIRKAN